MKKILQMTAALLVLVALIAGCRQGNGDPEDIYGGNLIPGPDWATGPGTGENEDCDAGSWTGYDPVVARVGGVYINASQVRREIFWAQARLRDEYIALFPDDMTFNYDRQFRDGVTFGQAIQEEAARLVMLVNMFENFARTHGLEFDNNDDFYHVVNVVIEATFEDPAIFSYFEAYMPEDELFNLSKAFAEEILARALAGEDFDALIAAYGTDPGMQTYPDGYTFTRYVMVQEFQDAVEELEIGQISGIVPSRFGFHIIKRVEPIPENAMLGHHVDPDDEDEELFGAKHILLRAEGVPMEERMVEAIFLAFEAMFDDGDFEFFPELYDVPVG